MDAGRSAEKRYLCAAPYLPHGQVNEQKSQGLADDVVSCLSQKVNQRNVPGIDNAYLAMDTEEGVEVVWNEVMFSERKNFKLQEVGAVRVSKSFTPYSQAIEKLLFLIFSFQFKISRWDQGFLYVCGLFSAS